MQLLNVSAIRVPETNNSGKRSLHEWHRCHYFIEICHANNPVIPRIAAE